MLTLWHTRIIQPLKNKYNPLFIFVSPFISPSPPLLQLTSVLTCLIYILEHLTIFGNRWLPISIFNLHKCCDLESVLFFFFFLLSNMFLGYPYLPVGLLLSSPFSIIGLSVSTTLTHCYCF